MGYARSIIIYYKHFQIILYEGSAPDQALPAAASSHAATNGGKSLLSGLPKDPRGRFISRLAIKNITNRHAGEYKCEPAASKPAKITVHVLNGTDQLAVSDHGKSSQHYSTLTIY